MSLYQIEITDIDAAQGHDERQVSVVAAALLDLARGNPTLKIADARARARSLMCRNYPITLGKTDDLGLASVICKELAAAKIETYVRSLEASPLLQEVPTPPSAGPGVVQRTTAALLNLTAGDPIVACQNAAILSRATGETRFWTDVLTELRFMFPWVIPAMTANDIPYNP